MTILLTIGFAAFIGGSLFVLGLRTGRRRQRDDDRPLRDAVCALVSDKRVEASGGKVHEACLGPDGHSSHSVHVYCSACLPRGEASRP